MKNKTMEKEIQQFQGKNRTMFFLLMSIISAVLLGIIGYTFMGLRGEMDLAKITQTMAVIDRTNLLSMFLIAVSVIGGVAVIVLMVMDIAAKAPSRRLWTNLVFGLMTIGTFIFSIDVYRLTNEFILTLQELTGGGIYKGIVRGVKKGITLVTTDIQGRVQFLTFMGGIALTLAIVCIIFYVVQLRKDAKEEEVIEDVVDGVINE